VVNIQQIANVNTLNHDDSNSHIFSLDGLEFGGPWARGPLALSGSATLVYRAYAEELGGYV